MMLPGVVVVSEFIHPVGVELLRASGLDVRYQPELWRDSEGLRREARRAIALVVRNRTRIDDGLLEAAPRLRVVGRLGVGLDNLDLEALKKRGVQLVYARGANAVGVAEYVLAAMLHLSRGLAFAAAHVHQGHFERERFGGFELAGKTIGLVGLGEVGLRVAARARALSMRVVANDPARRPGEAVVEEFGVRLVGLPQLLAESDFVSLHVPLTSETRNLIDKEALCAMKAGAYLINTARGALVDHLALVDALCEGRLAGAVLDVTEPEPLPHDHPLWQAPNVWITPHVAGLTREAQERVAREVVRGILSELGCPYAHPA